MVVRLKMYLEQSHAIHELKVNARSSSHGDPVTRPRQLLCGRQWLQCWLPVRPFSSKWLRSLFLFFLSVAVYLITAVIPAFNEFTEPRWAYSPVITSSGPAGWLWGSHDGASSAVTPHVTTLCVTMICCQVSSCSLVSMLPFYASHSSLLAIYFKVTQAVSVVSPLCFASKKWLFYGITLRILTGP